MKGAERAGGDVGQQAQGFDVVRMVAQLVVADQRAVGFAAGRAEFVFVDLLEESGLVEFDGPAQILEKLALRDVEHAHLSLVPVSLFITR